MFNIIMFLQIADRLPDNHLSLLDELKENKYI